MAKVWFRVARADCDLSITCRRSHRANSRQFWIQTLLVWGSWLVFGLTSIFHQSTSSTFLST